MCAWAWQLTTWVYPSHRQQNMVGMRVTLSSSASTNGKCVHEHGNLPPECIRVTVNKTWLEWEWHCQVRHQQTVNVCMSMATYQLSVSKSPSTKHGWNKSDIVKFGINKQLMGAWAWQLTDWVYPSHHINKTRLEREWHCQVWHQQTVNGCMSMATYRLSLSESPYQQNTVGTRVTLSSSASTNG